jgi:hypothetical protein
VIEDKVFAATPPSAQLKAWIVTGEVADMKVTQPIEQGSGSVVSRAKLTEELRPRNSSTDATVRFFAGKIQFIDPQGRPIRSDEKQIKPTIKFQTYAATEQLDPGQDAPRP